MEVLLFALFFLVTIVFFVAGKDDFGRKEIKLKKNQNEEVKNVQKDDHKEEIKKEVVSKQITNSITDLSFC